MKRMIIWKFSETYIFDFSFESEISSLVESSSSDPQTVYISPDAIVSAPPISASEAKKKDGNFINL